ncbi:PP2C family protein-serine/threonine phosphatase [Streptomyces sp. NPDC050636]|uniref:PP2C family protein-serine/threonine phosphatase n=1 Tax=Streptomyces sp. NPDC050636 TaxID=3154510 RepID=UPI003424102C
MHRRAPRKRFAHERYGEEERLPGHRDHDLCSRRRARDPPGRLRAPPPLLIRHRQVTPLQVRQPEPPLDLGEFTDPGYRVETFPFAAGDLLLLYADGVIEARDRAGAFYPLAERIASWDGDGSEALLRHIRDDLVAHSDGSLGDDAAMIALSRTPTPSTARAVK